MTINFEEIAQRLNAKDASLFVGETARTMMGWVDHPTRYLGAWLDDAATRLPRLGEPAALLGMGGSSSPARFYSEALSSELLTVLDTSNPDTISRFDFSNVTVLASSKSGTTIELQTLLAHALANGLTPERLVVITDPGNSLHQLAIEIGATLIEGDPSCGGRFSGISPFGLIPALYAGWTPTQLREEHAGGEISGPMVQEAFEILEANGSMEGPSLLPLPRDPLLSGGSLWLEQLVAETTGKESVGVLPVWDGHSHEAIRPSQMMLWHVVAAMAARQLNVDPFNQPNVESTKRLTFSLLQGQVDPPATPYSPDEVTSALQSSGVNVIQAFAPLDCETSLNELREGIARQFGTTTASIGPRYLHSTGQFFKGGTPGLTYLQVVVRPKSEPQRIAGRRYSFHDLFYAQAIGDYQAMVEAGRTVFQLTVDSLAEVSTALGLPS